MFAVTDATGRIIAFSGRALEAVSEDELKPLGLSGAPAAADAAKYINSPESPIYRKREAVFGLSQARQALRKEEECIIVEGNFDVVSLQARGIGNVVAPLGTAFTEDQARQIRRFAASVTLLFDGDSAGKRAVRAARTPCREAGLSVRVATLPEDSDPDDLVRSKGPETIQRIVKAAPGIVEYLIDAELDQHFKRDDSQGQAARIRAVSELIAEESDVATRGLLEQHVNRIAERLGIADARTFRALGRAVQGALRQGRADPEQRISDFSPWRARSPSQREEVGHEIFGAILDYPELLELTEMIDSLPFLEGDVAVAIAALRHELTLGLRQIPEQVLAKLPAAIHPFALARLAAPMHASLEDAKTVLFGNVRILRGLELQRQDVEAREETQRAARAGDFDRELELLREVQLSARQRRGL
jgi:DNA primase